MPVLKLNPDGTTHLHSYIRRRKTTQFMCSDPLCTHYIDRELLIGKLSLCPKCKRNTFLLSWRDLRMERPVCDTCSTRKKLGGEKVKIQNTLETLFPASTSSGAQEN